VDAAGELLVRETIESAPRRSGKSVRLRGTALWRIDPAQEARFGEPQLALFTGKDLPICKEIHRKAWKPAEEWGWGVRRQNGNEEIETPSGSRWMVRGQGSVYGYDTNLGMVDEGWGVPPVVVDEGLEPSLLERVQPQLLLTSTAHRRATSLMVDRITSAMAGAEDDPEVLLLLWGAGPLDPIDDPRGWRAAAPHWTAERERMMVRKLAAARRGQVDKDAQDDDPIEAFRAQYLNVWPDLTVGQRAAGVEVLEGLSWAELARVRPSSAPDVVAVDSWFGQGYAVVWAWRVPGGVLVGSQAAVDRAEAAGLVGRWGRAGRLLVGKSDVEWSGWSRPVDPVGLSARVSVFGLVGLARSGQLWHDGSELLGVQLGESRRAEVDGVDGPRLLPGVRSEAARAAFAAAQVALVEPPVWFSAGGGR
jgi:hypothetical protein